MKEIPSVGQCDLLQNSPVTEITVTDAGVSVVWREGSLGGRQQKADFDYALCTVPAPCVQRIQFNAANDPNSLDRAEALASITYGSAAKTLIHVRRRLWETPHSATGRPILGGGSFTDLPIQQVWYPSDQAQEFKPDDFADSADAGDDDPLPVSYRVEDEAEIPDGLDPAIREYARRAGASEFDHPVGCRNSAACRIRSICREDPIIAPHGYSASIGSTRRLAMASRGLLVGRLQRPACCRLARCRKSQPVKRRHTYVRWHER